LCCFCGCFCGWLFFQASDKSSRYQARYDAPAGGSVNPFGPTIQYTDGMNRYEYVDSNPIHQKDPMGLTAKNNQQVCCKIKTVEYYPVVLPDGLVISASQSTCTQETIPNPQGISAGRVCRCHYRNQKNVSLYDWHTEECCWCEVTLEGVKSDLSGTPSHFWVVVKCDKGGPAYIITIFAGSGGKFIVTPGITDEREGTGITLASARISCRTADTYRHAFGNREATTRFWTGLFCLGNSCSAYSLLKNECP